MGSCKPLPARLGGNSSSWPDREQRPSELQKLGYDDGLSSPQGRCLGKCNRWCL